MSEFRRQRDNTRALALLAGEGLLDRLAWVKPAKHKKTDLLDRVAEYATDDARRILAFHKAPRPKKQFAAEVAVERHLRIIASSPLAGRVRALSEEERHELVQKVIRRLEHPSGPARADRRRRITFRAK